jgi:hypothetical protein
MFLLLCILVMALTVPLQADVNILIIGSDTPGDQQYAARLSGSPAATPAFQYEAMADHLRQILEGGGHGTVNVTTRNRVAGSTSTSSFATACNNLLAWFYWRYGEWVNNDPVLGNYASVTGTQVQRWAELRGENGTEWDYVVLIGDPFTIETIPGYYTLGVARIAEEVAKGTGQTVLLMPWPAAGSSSTLDHYKEVVYRTGRTAGIPVAPAGLAWQAAGSPSGGTHPSADGSYIAAATLYSRLFGQSAANSSYNPHPTLAATAHTTVTANQGAPQYSGPFEFNNPFKMLGDKRRHHYNSNRGTSTENRIRRHLNDDTLPDLKITRNWINADYTSNTPDDDGINWPNWPPTAYNWGRHRASAGDGPTKSYFTNRDFWQLGFGFAYHATDDTNTYLSQISTRELALAYLMKEGTTSFTSYNLNAYDRQEEIATARLIPLHTLWATINREYPNLPVKADQSHINRALGKSGATFMATIYSGRTPIQDTPQASLYVADPVLNQYVQRIGYETAWIVGNVQARAPGLKITPSTTNTSAASEIFTVRFFFRPQEDVTVHVAVSDPTRAEVSHETLVFTPDNYNIPQFVSSRALNRNSVLSGGYDVLFTTTSDDEVFDGLNDEWAFTMPANAVPSIDITTPSEGENFPVGTDLTVSVNSSDPDGSVAHVTLWINDVQVRQDSSAPYQWSPANGDALLADLVDDVYRLRIVAVDNQGVSYTVHRMFTVGTPELTPPPAPTGFAAVPNFGKVNLSWNESTQGDFFYYSVYRSTTEGVFPDDPIASGLTDSQYTDTDVENDTSYFYVVTATDTFLNESAFSEEREATPGLGAGATRFGAERDGYGGFTTSVIDSGESWTVLPASVRYINDDPDGPGGAEGPTRNGTLLKQYPIDRSEGSSYRVQGVVHLHNGYADDNNRVGIYLFGSTANPSRSSAETGALYMFLNLANSTLAITRGINGTGLVTTTKLGTLQGNALFGTDLIFTADITFIGEDIEINATLLDANSELTPISTTVTASSFTGEFFGFGTRARTRGTTGKTNPFTMDYKSFGVSNTATPPAPVGLRVYPDESFAIMNWDASDDPTITAYRVYRGESPGQYDEVSISGNLAQPTFLDATVQDDVTYYYAVTAVRDGQFESDFSDEVSLTFIPNYAAPVVDAGNPQTADWNEGIDAIVDLDGTVSDPDGNALTIIWSLESGPAAVIFADATAVDTFVTFTEPGTYVLRLTASDGLYTTSDEVTITVTEKGTVVDSNNNGIDDAWEMATFGRLLGENETVHESGVPFYFMYLHGTDLNDPSDRFRVSVEPSEGSESVVFAWEVLSQFELGVDYDIRISTNLSQWDPIPSEHYSLEQTPVGDRTRTELNLTHDYGDRVFFRLNQPY